MYYIYTVEYYSAIKNEDIMNFAGKWVKLENIILNEVTETQNGMHGMCSLISAYYPKFQNTMSRLIYHMKFDMIEVPIFMFQSHFKGE